MPYRPNNLQPFDPTSDSWALAQARLRAKDKGPTERLTDTEWLSYLEDTAIIKDGLPHYRPHEAAAVAIETDPDALLSESLMGASAQYRDPAAVAAAIRKGGAWIDGQLGLRLDRFPSVVGVPVRVVF